MSDVNEVNAGERPLSTMELYTIILEAAETDKKFMNTVKRFILFAKDTTAETLENNGEKTDGELKLLVCCDLLTTLLTSFAKGLEDESGQQSLPEVKTALINALKNRLKLMKTTEH